MTPHRVTTLTHGQPEYADLLDQIRQDSELMARMWADAESRPEELDRPGTLWSVALVQVGARWAPAAWCAVQPQADGVLRCHSNYEAPQWRNRGLYAAAYRERHHTVVLPCGVPAVTYLFVDPIAVHEADGWRQTGREGAGEVYGHWWRELRRAA